MNLSTPVAEDIPIDPDALLRIGTVLSVDLETARCVVQIGDPDAGAIETPGIRWGAGRLGKTRIWMPPVVDEQVVVAFPAGELAAGVVIASIASNIFPPAGNFPADLITFEDGAVISYDVETATLVVQLPEGGSIVVTAPGGVLIDAQDGVTIDGPVTINGNLSVTGSIAATDDVTADVISLKNHLHGNVASGSAKTGMPE